MCLTRCVCACAGCGVCNVKVSVLKLWSWRDWFLHWLEFLHCIILANNSQMQSVRCVSWFQYEEMQLSATKHGDDLKSSKAEIAEYKRNISRIQSEMEMIKGQVRTLLTGHLACGIMFIIKATHTAGASEKFSKITCKILVKWHFFTFCKFAEFSCNMKVFDCI